MITFHRILQQFYRYIFVCRLPALYTFNRVCFEVIYHRFFFFFSECRKHIWSLKTGDNVAIEKNFIFWFVFWQDYQESTVSEIYCSLVGTLQTIKGIDSILRSMFAILCFSFKYKANIFKFTKPINGYSVNFVHSLNKIYLEIAPFFCLLD